jgi:hypothetical protein
VVVIEADHVDLLLGIDCLYHVKGLAGDELKLLVGQSKADEVFVPKGVHECELCLCPMHQLEGRAIQIVNGAFDILSDHSVVTDKLDKVRGSLQHELFGRKP